MGHSCRQMEVHMTVAGALRGRAKLRRTDKRGKEEQDVRVREISERGV